MDTFRIRHITESDIFSIISECGGKIAHPYADRRDKRGCDFAVGQAAIELKLIDEDGFEKNERQSKLSQLFRANGFSAPVVVLDRSRLPDNAQRNYDRIVEGPIKSAVASARRQLKQTREEQPETKHSLLWIINNGYTALDHDELVTLVVRRARNDSSNIDGVIVGGCYFYSDGFDSFFLWPLDYVPIRLVEVLAFKDLKIAWNSFANRFMSTVVRGELGPDAVAGPVIDSQFEVDGITFVKPAPPIGASSEYYIRGRPRINSSGIITCPPVALTFPSLTAAEWKKFRHAELDDFVYHRDFDDWLRHEQNAADSGSPTKPFVRVPVTFDGWMQWHTQEERSPFRTSVYNYANHLFNVSIKKVVSSAREMKDDLLLSCYVLAVTEEIGMDKANDLSHLIKIREHPDGRHDHQLLAENLRIFHEHAVALAGVYAYIEGLEIVMWLRDQRYAWV